MKSMLLRLTLNFVVTMTVAVAGVGIDDNALGDSLGGWKKRSNAYAQYAISGAKYRTYRPEVTVTPSGGAYVSVRIDHVRGWFSTDDYAVLEITLDRSGMVSSAQSNIAIQGRSISSDVIRGVGKVGGKAPGLEQAVQVGTDLVADLTSKLLREKIVEPGRITFPSAVRHNYNLLFEAIRVNGKHPEFKDRSALVNEPVKPTPPEKDAPATLDNAAKKDAPAAAEKPAKKEEEQSDEPASANLQQNQSLLIIKNYEGIDPGFVNMRQ